MPLRSTMTPAGDGAAATAAGAAAGWLLTWLSREPQAATVAAIASVTTRFVLARVIMGGPFHVAGPSSAACVAAAGLRAGAREAARPGLPGRAVPKGRPA